MVREMERVGVEKDRGRDRYIERQGERGREDIEIDREVEIHRVREGEEVVFLCKRCTYSGRAAHPHWQWSCSVSGSVCHHLIHQHYS